MVNNELTHYGILGMKWGVRRSEAELARARKYTEDAQNIVRESKNINRSIGDIRSATNKVNLSSMSDSELRERVNRMNLEQQYANLSANAKSKGQAYVSNTLEVAGSALAITTSALAIALSIKQLKS